MTAQAEGSRAAPAGLDTALGTEKVGITEVRVLQCFSAWLTILAQ